MQRQLGFRHVEAIRAVMLTGSVTGAAERLYVTQPAVSNMLRDAEERLGFTLFERRSGRLVPNKSAVMLFDEIERSFTGLSQINSLTERIRQGLRRQVVIACTPVFGAVVLPHVLARLREQADDTFFTVHSKSAEHVAALVSSQKADIGFALDLPPLSGVSSEVVARLPMVCYLPKAHPLARRRRAIRAADLAGDRMITLSRSEGVDTVVWDAFSACEQTPIAIVECPAAIAACSMVAAGLGFTIFDPLPASLLTERLLCVRRFEPLVHLTYRAYWLDSRSRAFDPYQLLHIAREETSRLSSQWNLDRA